MNFMFASLPLDEEKKQKTSQPIESSVVYPIFVLSAMIVVVAGIYFYKTLAPQERTTPLTNATPVLATVTTSLPMATQKVKDESSI